MDPDVCYAEYIEAKNNNNFSLAMKKANELMEWLRKGGFEPDWTSGQKLSFLGSKRI